MSTLAARTPQAMPLGESSRRAARCQVAGSASAEPGFPVEQFACDLKVAGVRGRLLDHVEDDPADARDLGGVLRVRVEVEPARRLVVLVYVAHRLWRRQ